MLLFFMWVVAFRGLTREKRLFFNEIVFKRLSKNYGSSGGVKLSAKQATTKYRDPSPFGYAQGQDDDVEQTTARDLLLVVSEQVLTAVCAKCECRR
jgi:hypothetical protein